MWPQARIDLQALRDNLQQVRALAPRSRVMAIIKANGYGHGLLRAARSLQDADAFGVARIDEGIALRAAGIRHPVVVLEGFVDGEDLARAVHGRLDVVVHEPSQVALLEAAHLARPVRVWIKVDTGMHRLGFPPEQLQHVWLRLHRCRAVAGPLRVLSHLAHSDDPRDGRNQLQVELFHQVVGGVHAERSLANSGAILASPLTHFEWVRPGIMLYGVSPFMGGMGLCDGLRPVMTLVSRLIAINYHRQGAALGYGGAWVCPEDMAVGVAAIGYGDGYPRHAHSGTPVLIRGQRSALIGRVSMDMICIDLRATPQARVGDEVILWGAGLPVEEVAERAATIAYQLLCGVGQRVRWVEV
jgi:alanine racemase